MSQTVIQAYQGAVQWVSRIVQERISVHWAVGEFLEN